MTAARSYLHVAVAAALVAAFALAAFAAPADAGRRLDEDLSRGYVVAESDYGNGRVTGAVRWTGLGPQVQLPGGNWEYCRRSCSETLRVETVDFWEAQQNFGGTFAAECGVFGCLELNFGW